jgi:hypothetical protein
MVFQVKNLRKKVLLKMTVSLLIILTLMICLAQLFPVNAQAQSANLTGTISDQGVDNDGDSIYESLKIGIQVNVTVAGTFRIDISGLYDSKSSLNISNQNSTYLDVGIQTVYVSLTGTTIYNSQINPSNISTIILYNESASQLDSLSDITLSKDYFYFEFGITPASLTGIISDEGVTTDDDGAFNILRLGVEINVTIAGTYVVDAGGIYDPSFNSVSVLTKNSTFLNPGVHFVYLDLDGPEIYAAAVNPTTIASIFLFDSSNTTLSELHDLTLPTSYSFDQFQRPPSETQFSEIERKITLNQVGTIHVANNYRIKNLGFSTNLIEIGFPVDANDFRVRDEMGTLETSFEDGSILVNLRTDLDQNSTEAIYMFYSLPWENYISQPNGGEYTMDFTFYEKFNTTIGTLNVSVVLPKGAEFKSSITMVPYRIEKTGNQETIIFELSNVIPSQDLNFAINYKYLTFWSSFYPTIWVGILAFAGSIIAFFWKVPKPSRTPIITVQPKALKSFVKAYEEKTRIRSELESLSERLQKRKIPRRRYKIRKKMLDGRISSISRNISSLTEQIRSAGSKYAKMIKQLKVAETKLEEAEKNLKRLESRYRNAEISKAEYGKLQEEYQTRIDDAETTIDEVLLRLRE